MTQELSKWQELLNTKEKLCSELEMYYETGNGKLDMLRHPLIYSVPHFEGMNAMCNYRLVILKEEVQKKLAEKDYSGYVYLHEKPYRINAFLEIEDKLSNKDYWELLSDVWVNSENIWQNLATWKELLTDNRSGKMHFMNAEERKKLRSLPDVVTVYRGCTNKNKNGLSYTLDKNRAIFFTKYRFAKDGRVIKKEVPKTKIFAYLNGRNEDEIIIL